MITISKKAKNLISDLAIKYDLKLVILFGSSARGAELQKSDLDIAILADHEFYEKHYQDFIFDIAEVENLEKREIEIVPISDRNPILLYNIFNDGIPLYIKDNESYWRTRNWARHSYEENSRFFYGREKLINERLAKV